MFLEIVLFGFIFFLLLNARNRISRLEHRITLLEQSAANNLYNKVGTKKKEAPEAKPEPATIQKPAPLETPAAEPVKLAARVIYASKRPEAVQSIEIPEPNEVRNEDSQPAVSIKQAVNEIVKPAKKKAATTPTETFLDKPTHKSAEGGGNNHSAPPPPPKRASFNFEEFFGRRLPIWAGGITLAIAGVLIVKYAYDAGMLSRWVQVIGGLLFGTGLIAGAEIAFRKETSVRDPRVRQALSGAGLATLYATVLVAHNAYALISPLTAFIAMAAVTAGALGLSIRFGAPSALLGLAGGLATPALVGSLQPDVPLLSLYLALTIGGLTAVSRTQRWAWLGVSALIGGAGWGAYLIATSALDFASSLSIGGLVILLAIGLPFVAFTGPRASLTRAASAIIGAAQIATLVAVGGYSPLHWGLFGLIAIAGQWLSWREKGFEIVPSISLGISAMLLVIWPDPMQPLFTAVAISMAIIHGVPLMVRLWNVPSRFQIALELVGLSLAILIIPMVQFYALDGSRDSIFGLLALAGAMLAAIGVTLGWRREERHDDARFAMLTTSAFLGVCAFWFVTVQWAWPIGIAIAAAILLLFGHRAKDARLEKVAAVFALATLPFIVATGGRNMPEIFSLFGLSDVPIDLYAVGRWMFATALFILFAMRAELKNLRFAAAIIAALLGYGMLSQIVPGWAVPIALVASVATLLLLGHRSDDGRIEPATGLIAASAVPLLVISASSAWNEWSRLFGYSNATFSIESVIRWAVVAALYALFAARAKAKGLRLIGYLAASIIGYGALAQIVPGWSVPIALSASIAALLLFGERSDDKRIEIFAALFSVGTILLLINTGANPFNELLRLIGLGDATFVLQAAVRWTGVAALFVLFAVRAKNSALRIGAQAIASALTYGILAQMLPPVGLPLIPATGVLALAYASKKLAWPTLAPGLAVAAAIALSWTIETASIWVFKALLSMASMPLMVDAGFPNTAAFLNHLLIPGMLMGVGIWLLRDHLPRRAMQLSVATVCLLGFIGIHGLYRIGFAQMLPGDFAHTGVVQRVIWAVLLISAGWAVWTRYAQNTVGKPLALTLIGAGTLHGLYYGLLLHNPLWQAQAVGGLPLVNLLIPIYALVPLGIWLLSKVIPDTVTRFARILQVGAMILITLFSYASLRQIFHGTFLISPGTSDLEDILRSIIAIALAIGFLLWGIRHKQRDWRIASLILMIAAVGKVFLLDASGLQGLMRIGSFVALGFSLIGLGWLYSRQLRSNDPEEATG